MLVPINVDDQRTITLAQSFGCKVGSFLSTYLGLPLGVSKPKVIDCLPLVKKCELRLSATSAFFSQAGRLEVTNSIFTALPMYFMNTFKLHKTVVKQIDKYRKHCLWRGSDINAKTPPKAAWDLVRLPKKEGGLGVLNLETQNDALLLKNLHKFYNRLDIPWVHLIWESYYTDGSLPTQSKRKGSFWWKDILKLIDSFKGLAMIHVSDGATCLFLDDLWNSRVPRLSYPELFSFAKDPHISLKEVLALDLNN